LDDLDRVAWCYARAARAAWEGGDFDRGREIADEGLDGVGSAPESADLADLLHEAARACHFSGVPDRAKSLCQRALEMAEKTGSTKIQAEALTTMAVLDGVQPDDAIVYLEKAIDLAQSQGLPDQESRARNNLAFTLGGSRGDVKSARDHLRRAAKIARKTGKPAMELGFRALEAGWAAWQGELSYAEEEFVQLQQLYEEASRPAIAGNTLRIFEIMVDRLTGELSKSADRFREPLVESREGGRLQDVSFINNLLADLLLETGHLEQAESAVHEMLEVSEKIGGRVSPRIFMAILAAKRGLSEEAQQYLQEAGEQPNEEPTALDAPGLTRAKALIALADGHFDEAWDHFREESELWKQFGIRTELGRCLLSWATAHIDRGDSENLIKARGLLQEARGVFEDIGAQLYVEQVDARLKELESAAS